MIVIQVIVGLGLHLLSFLLTLQITIIISTIELIWGIILGFFTLWMVFLVQILNIGSIKINSKLEKGKKNKIKFLMVKIIDHYIAFVLITLVEYRINKLIFLLYKHAKSIS